MDIVERARDTPQAQRIDRWIVLRKNDELHPSRTFQAANLLAGAVKE
jgi:hypothetical protein